MRIVVHGATGAQGSPIVVALAKAGHEVAALSRHPQAVLEGATPVAATLDDQSSLADAYEGADVVFVHLPMPADPDAPGRWAGAVIGAVAAAGVGRVVLSSSGASLEESGPDPMLVARLSGMRRFHEGLTEVADSVVVLAPRLFLENLLLPFVSGPLLAEGVLAYPLAADKPISWTSHLDVAEAVVVAVDSDIPAGVYDIGPAGPLTRAPRPPLHATKAFVH